MKYLLVLLTAFSLWGMGKAPRNLTRDIVYLKNGEEINGSVLEIGKDSVYISTPHGRIAVARTEVLSIESSRRRPGDMWENISDIDDSLLLKALKVPVDSLYPMAGYVNVYVIKKFTLNTDSSYSYTERRIIRILKERGKRAANRVFKYMSSFERGEIVFARTVTHDDRVVSIMDNAIEDASVFSRYPEYDDLHQVKFAIPEGSPGNVLDYEIKITGKFDPKHPPLRRILMGDREPTYYEKLEIEGNKDLLLITARNTGGIESEGNSFIVRDHKGYIEEPYMPPLYYILPAFTCGLKTGEDIHSLRTYIDSLVDSFKPDSLLDGLLSKAQSREDTLFSIYRFVAQDIKRIPVDGESYSIFPKSPDLILNKFSGSEVDKAFLLYSLYRKVGIPADLVLTVSKSSWFLPENWNLSLFTGMVVRLDTIYLDPVNDRMPFGYIRPEFQGTHGISLNGDETYIPFTPVEREGQIEFMNIAVTRTGDLVIEDNVLFRGYDEATVRALKKFRKIELQKILEQNLNWAPGITLDSFRLSDLGDLTIPPKLTLFYRVPGYAIVADNLILLKMPDLSDYTAEKVGATFRLNPLFFERNYRSIKDIVIKLPPGFRVRHIPEGFSGQVKFMEFKSLVYSSKDTVHYSDEVRRKGGIYDKSLYKDFRKIVEGMARQRDSWIVIERMKY